MNGALKESGYRIVAKGDPGYDSARALSAEVDQFWSWMTPGFTAIALEYEARLTLEGDWPVDKDKRDVRGYARVTGMFGGTSLWQEVFNAGLANLVDRIKLVVKKPTSEPQPVRGGHPRLSQRTYAPYR